MPAVLTAAPEGVAFGEDLGDFLPEVCPLAACYGVEVRGELKEVCTQ
jgi:hypothetical protein